MLCHYCPYSYVYYIYKYLISEHVQISYMSSVYSKLCESEVTSEAKNQNISPEPDQLDNDLTDIIKTNDGCHSTQKKRYAKFPCSMCDKNCNKNQQAIFCTSCLNWVHQKFNGTTQTEYERLSQEPDDLPFHCMLCIMKQNSQFIPLFLLHKSELLELNGIDLPSQLSSSESYELKSKLTGL